MVVEKGRLTIVGSGIKAIAHLTQEAVVRIKAADVVFFKVIDGASAAFIRGLNSSAIDLSQYYGDDKRRRVTYIQMAEVMLNEVRAGRSVVGVFYGHPGFFVDPARRALAVADKEGYPTEMLAGISSLDTLFADLRFDPAQHGCQMLEATDMLLRKRPIIASGHVIVLQVGSVGDAAYNFAHGYRNNRRAMLFDHLIAAYGADHPSVLYLGATLPGAKPRMIKRRLSAYRDPAVLSAIHPASTLYLPPKDRLATDPEMAERMGARWVLSPAAVRVPLAEYGPQELEAVAALPVHAPSRDYRLNLATPALLDTLTRLALDPATGAAFDRDPEGTLALFPGLSATERAALLSRDVGRLNAAIASAGPKPGDADSNTDIHVTEPSPEETETETESNTDIHVTEETESNTDIHVTEEVESNTDIHVTEEVESNTDIHVAEEDTEK